MTSPGRRSTRRESRARGALLVRAPPRRLHRRARRGRRGRADAAAASGPRVVLPSGAVFALEVARTDAEQVAQGLMFRESLAPAIGDGLPLRRARGRGPSG